MTTFNLDERMAVVVHLAAKAGSQTLGRTALMKMMYFLQEARGVPLGYHFRLFTYGPFDSEVLSDLATATTVGVVKEGTVIYPRGYGYQITPGNSLDGFFRMLEASHPDTCNKIDEVVGELRKCNAAELELRSTIHFIDRELGQSGTPVDRSTLADRVNQVKPHFSSHAILHSLEIMKRNGWLHPSQGDAVHSPG